MAISFVILLIGTHCRPLRSDGSARSEKELQCCPSCAARTQGS